MASKDSTISDWLRDATQLQPGDRLEIYLGSHQGPPPLFTDMRAALHAQFGADTPIRIYKHGQRISIFITSTEADRKIFDARRVGEPYVGQQHKTGKPVEWQNGFERDLPSTGEG